jgi:ABC-type lipoprotein release transport system permease subunit
VTLLDPFALRSLFDVHPLDPAAMLGAILLLMGVATAACYLPARCAARVDPIAMLRLD